MLNSFFYLFVFNVSPTLPFYSFLLFCCPILRLLYLSRRTMVISDVRSTADEVKLFGDLHTFLPNHSIVFMMSYQHFLFLSSVSMATLPPSLPFICHLLFYYLHVLITCLFLTPVHDLFLCPLSPTCWSQGLKALAPSCTPVTPGSVLTRIHASPCADSSSLSSFPSSLMKNL